MQDQAQTTGQSTFVTVLAWLFIVGAGFAVLISALQNIMINTMMPIADIPPPSGPDADRIPGFFKFMFSNLRLVFFSFFVISVATLVSAIGLLKRRNWARLVFIGLLALGIVWNIAGLVLQQTFMSSMGVPAEAPPHIRAEFERTASFMLVFGMVFVLGFSALFGWLIKRLMSTKVRLEFGQAA